MRILYITHYSDLYGANKSLLQLVIDLRIRYDIKPLIIVPGKGIFTEELEKNKISFVVVRSYNWLNNNSFFTAQIKRILNQLLFYYAFVRLRSTFKKFDLIHTNSSVSKFGGYLSQKIKKPHIWHIREYGKDDYNLNFYTGIKNAGSYFNKNSSCVIAISQDLKKFYSKYINPDKIKVIYNGIKKKEFFLKVYNERNPINLCFLGVLSENKNQLEAVQAIDYLVNTKKRTDFLLHIVGNGSKEYLAVLKNFIEKKNIQKYVRFVGYIADVDSFLKNMDVGIVCSKREAFGRVTVEFMMNKIPVIASNTGANKEIIKNDKIGQIYKYGDPVQLGERINKFITNRDSIRIIAENAYLYACDHFTSELNTDKIFDIYTTVLEESKIKK